MRFGIAVLLLCLAGPGRSAEEPPLPTVREIVASAGDRRVRVTLVLFDSKDFVLRIVDNVASGEAAKYRRLASAMRSLDAVAGCNGGFFERHPFAPVGVMTSDGVRTGTLDPASWMKGLIVMRNDGPHLESTESFRDTPDIKQLLQSGPWLVRAGLAESSNDPRMAPRTFIGRETGLRWALGLSEPCTLAELAAVLTSEPVAAALRLDQALNLDGGPSSGLWAKKREGEFSVPERWTVRNYVAVFPANPASPP